MMKTSAFHTEFVYTHRDFIYTTPPQFKSRQHPALMEDHILQFLISCPFKTNINLIYCLEQLYIIDLLLMTFLDIDDSLFARKQ